MNDKTKAFINKVKAKDSPRHRDSLGNWLYTYDKVDYSNSYTKVTVTCDIHGDFEIRPNDHLQGRGCYPCSLLSRANKRTYTKQEFINKAQIKHNNKYTYEKINYKNTQIKITITCPEHGDFKQAGASHLVGSGCPVCAGTNKNDLKTFISKANIIHNNIYSYKESIYINSDSRITITCPEHGNFKQVPYSHLSGSGCPVCSSNAKGYTKTMYKNQCIKNNNGLGILYVIHCFNDTEYFYKVGRTSLSVAIRFRNKSKLPYDYKVIYTIIDEPNTIYDLENKLLSLRKYKYKPLISFKGETECFSDISLIEGILKENLVA